jgi:cell division septation protein DedD
MTTQEATHTPADTGEETSPFPTSLLETAPPLILESEPTPFLESEPTLLFESEPAPSFEVAPEPPLLLETAAPSIEYTPPSASPRSVATPKPARKANKNAPDPFAVGIRLLRMAPAWLLFTTVICGALVLVLGWVKGDGNAPVPPKQNDARAVQTAPKASAPAPKTAAANAPEVATPASVPAAAPVQNAAPAPVEQPTPKAPEKAQAEQPAQADVAGAKFTVQVGSHSDQSEANEQVSRLRAAGFEARSVAAELPGRGTWYRVQVGRFADRAEATKAVGQLRAKSAAASAMVVPLQN